MTATTISSSMPSVSILGGPLQSAPGEGGGVFSATLPALFGRSSRILRGCCLEGLLTAMLSEELLEGERFIFLDGGCPSLTGVIVGGERCEEALELFGTWMPSDSSDSDLRRVL